MTPFPHMNSLVRQVTTTRRLALDRVNRMPAWVVLTELFIGLGWLRAFAEKLIDPGWWRGEAIVRFAVDHAEVTLGWYRPFLETLVLPLAPLVALLVMLLQLGAGISLVTGRGLAAGLAVGMFLNVHFMAAGAVTPSAFYLLAQGALVLWLSERAQASGGAGALRIAAAVSAFAVGLNVPFIATLHPAHVIEDPAVMFAFGGALAALTSLLAASTPLTERRPRRSDLGSGSDDERDASLPESCRPAASSL